MSILKKRIVLVLVFVTVIIFILYLQSLGRIETKPLPSIQPIPRLDIENTRRTFVWADEISLDLPSSATIYQIIEPAFSSLRAESIASQLGFPITSQKQNGSQMLWSKPGETLSIGTSPSYLNYFNRQVGDQPGIQFPIINNVISSLDIIKDTENQKQDIIELLDPKTGNVTNVPVITIPLIQTLANHPLVYQNSSVGIVQYEENGTVRSLIITGALGKTQEIGEIKIPNLENIQLNAETRSIKITTENTITDFNKNITVSGERVISASFAYYTHPDSIIIYPSVLLTTANSLEFIVPLTPE